MLGPLAPLAHCWIANACAFARLYEQAIAHYRHAVAIEPHRQRAWRSLGFLLSELKDWNGAIEALERAVALDPRDAATRFNLGFLQHQQGALDAAIEQFKAAIARQPTLDRAWYGLGVIYLERLELDAAIEHLREAARLQYFNPYAAHHLILAYARAGRHGEGRKELKRLEGFDPKAAKAAADAVARIFTSH